MNRTHKTPHKIPYQKHHKKHPHKTSHNTLNWEKWLIGFGCLAVILSAYLYINTDSKKQLTITVSEQEIGEPQIIISDTSPTQEREVAPAYEESTIEETKPIAGSQSAQILADHDNIQPLPAIFWGYLKLMETIFFGHNHPQNRAVIKDLISLKESRYPLNEILPYGSKLVRIMKDRITLEKDGRKRALKLFVSIGDAKTKKEFAKKGYQQVTDNEWLIKPNKLLKNNNTIAGILHDTKISSTTDMNGVERFKINKLKQGNLIAELGIEEGDTINTINGTEIRGIKDFLSAYKRAKESTTITISVERNQMPTDISYQIVPDGEPGYNIEEILTSPNLFFGN